MKVRDKEQRSKRKYLERGFLKKKKKEEEEEEDWGEERSPVVKNPPANSGDMGPNPGQGTEIPHAMGQLSSCAIATESVCSRAHILQ